MTLTDQVVKNIIKRLIKGQDYRIENGTGKSGKCRRYFRMRK